MSAIVSAKQSRLSENGCKGEPELATFFRFLYWLIRKLLVIWNRCPDELSDLIEKSCNVQKTILKISTFRDPPKFSRLISDYIQLLKGQFFISTSALTSKKSFPYLVSSPLLIDHEASQLTQSLLFATVRFLPELFN